MTSAILAEGRTSISLPFTFVGELANYTSFASRATPGSAPLFMATFTGGGVAGLLARRRVRRSIGS